MFSDPVAITAMFCRSSSDETGLAIALISAARSLDAFCSPRCSAIGLAPEATSLSPSITSACVRIDDVVVPSPAFWSVLEATSTSRRAPTFARWSSSSTSRAMVTPSLTTSGTPYARSSTTFRPFGPSVTLTAFATASMPASSDCRLSSPKVTSVAMRTAARRAGGPGRGTGPTHPAHAHAASALASIADLGAGMAVSPAQSVISPTLARRARAVHVAASPLVVSLPRGAASAR